MKSEFLLQIKDLKASIEDKEIIKGLSLEVRPGEIHAIMGPNGSGKSTLANVLTGRDIVTVTHGSVTCSTCLLKREPVRVSSCHSNTR